MLLPPSTSTQQPYIHSLPIQFAHRATCTDSLLLALFSPPPLRPPSIRHRLRPSPSPGPRPHLSSLPPPHLGPIVKSQTSRWDPLDFTVRPSSFSLGCRREEGRQRRGRDDGLAEDWCVEVAGVLTFVPSSLSFPLSSQGQDHGAQEGKEELATQHLVRPHPHHLTRAHEREKRGDGRRAGEVEEQARTDRRGRTPTHARMRAGEHERGRSSWHTVALWAREGGQVGSGDRARARRAKAPTADLWSDLWSSPTLLSPALALPRATHHASPLAPAHIRRSGPVDGSGHARLTLNPLPLAPSPSLLQIEGVAAKEEAQFYLGKRVAYVYRAQREIKGSKVRVMSVQHHTAISFFSQLVQLEACKLTLPASSRFLPFQLGPSHPIARKLWSRQGQVPSQPPPSLVRCFVPNHALVSISPSLPSPSPLYLLLTFHPFPLPFSALPYSSLSPSTI